jgi:hypothetical protein
VPLSKRHQELVRPVASSNWFESWSGLPQKAGPALFAQAVAVAADGDDLAVVQQSVEDRGGDDRIAHGTQSRAPRPAETGARGKPVPAERTIVANSTLRD